MKAQRTFSALAVAVSAAVGGLLASTSPARAEPLSKADQILLRHGLLVQGMVTKDDVFHPDTFKNANYSAVNWFFEPDFSRQKDLIWGRWVPDEKHMPAGAELAHADRLISLQMADEWNLNDPKVRQRAVDWFNAIRDQYPHTILNCNNYGGQVGDAELTDFRQRARPDMISFDYYPWQCDWAGPNTAGAVRAGPPTQWYSELRRYRAHALASHIPFGSYVQTFHAIQDYDHTVYRDPSPSELRLNHTGALAFNAKALIDFTYNTGASSLFTKPGGDTHPTPLYAEKADAARRARNLGKALVHLTPIEELHRPVPNDPNPALASSDVQRPLPDGAVTSILFLLGNPDTDQHSPLPIEFFPDPQAPRAYTWWEADKNDPHLRGWKVTNKGTKNAGRPGDVILSWFKPIAESPAAPTARPGEVYIMVVNALTDPTGSAADCAQDIALDFDFKTGAESPSVDLLDPETGRVSTRALPKVGTPTDSTSRHQLLLHLNGGDAALFKFTTGAPFVGATSTPGAQ